MSGRPPTPEQVRVLQALRAGYPAALLAEEGVMKLTSIYALARRHGIKIKKGLHPMTRANLARDAEIRRLRRQRLTLQEIGERVGLGRERVRQILAKNS